MTNIISHFEGVQEKGQDRWQCQCPAHNDNRASLSIARGREGWVMTCHAGCSTTDILNAAGLSWGDLFYDPWERDSEILPGIENIRVGPAPAATVDLVQPVAVDTGEIEYRYCDREGLHLYSALRLPGKQFRQRAADGSWKVGHIPKVPYRLPELLESTDTVFIVEGEKDVENLRAIGLTATCNAGGAGKWKAEYCQHLAGRSVVVLPDNDEPGRKHAVKVADMLENIANRVLIVDLPDLPEKGDVSDWLGAGGTKEQLLGLVPQKRTQKQERKPPPPPVASVQRDFPLDRIPGFIQGVVDANLDSAMFPQRNLAYASAIALIAAVLSREVVTEMGTTANLYILGVAPTASGKNHGRKINQLICDKAGVDVIGPEDIASGSGLVNHLKATPAALFQLDEFGYLLNATVGSRASSHMREVAKNLLVLYSSADNPNWMGKAYADTNHTPRIRYPHANIYGTTTPETFWRSLSRDNVSDGLLGRMLVFGGNMGDIGKPKPIEIPGWLVEFVRMWKGPVSPADGTVSLVDTGAGALKQMDEIAISEEAKDRLWDHITEIHKKRTGEDSERSAIWGRVGEKTAKLALLFAASRAMNRNFVVELEDVGRAIVVSNWSTRLTCQDVSERLVESDYQRDADEMRQYIDEKGEVTRSQISNRFRRLKVRERNEIIDDLAQRGAIEVVVEPTSGRAKTTLKSTSNGGVQAQQGKKDGP